MPETKKDLQKGTAYEAITAAISGVIVSPLTANVQRGLHDSDPSAAAHCCGAEHDTHPGKRQLHPGRALEADGPATRLGP